MSVFWFSCIIPLCVDILINFQYGSDAGHFTKGVFHTFARLLNLASGKVKILSWRPTRTIGIKQTVNLVGACFGVMRRDLLSIAFGLGWLMKCISAMRSRY